MCPLRVLVILLSLLVALIALFISNNDEEDSLTQIEGIEEFQQQSLIVKCKTVFVDFATGRYLYKTINKWRGKGEKKQKKGDKETDSSPSSSYSSLQLLAMVFSSGLILAIVLVGSMLLFPNFFIRLGIPIEHAFAK